jgi:competence protein ComEA
VEIRARLTVLIALVILSLAGGVSAGQGKIPAASPAQHESATQPTLIDINSASRAQLKTLPWIGDTEAERIVAGRPYLSKAGLVTDNIIPAGVYQAIRNRIIAIQHTTPAHPATAER